MGRMRFATCLLEVLLFAGGTWSLPTDQIPLRGETRPNGLVNTNKKRPLHGRFLHVTDFHPDSFYQVYSSTAEDSACHRGTGPAGIYGAETSECDSPFELVNKTFEWIGQEFKDNIDFVVWTGDSARHDNDEEHPRSTAQVAGLNEFMVQKMFETFGKHNGDEEDEDPNNDFEIPIVPNLGNNDVLPHNIMTRGPNSWTRAYARIWRRFIPEAQIHAFEQGGWFYVETIPGRLAVFSLNTLYFFQSNAAVDGCAARSEPGYRQMEWLRIQLQYMRDRGMKAILIGHVPPARADAKKQWDETCWQKYTLWLQQYRDVVVAGLWGHMNYDHFFLQDFRDINKDTQDGRMKQLDVGASTSEDDVHASLSSDYFIDLREQWSKLPKPPKSLHWINAMEDELRDASDDQRPDFEIEEVLAGSKKSKDKKKKQQQQRKKFLKEVGGDWAENFAVSFASASVVPNLLPVIRVFEYNITGLDEDTEVTELEGDSELDSTYESWMNEDEANINGDINTFMRKKKKPLTHKFVVPQPPSKSAPPGPAYSPQTLSLLGYTQYLANLTHINNDFSASDVAPAEENTNDFDTAKWNEGKHKGKKPHEKDQTPNPKKFQFQVHYDTRNDTVYNLPDLTMRSMLGLARRIGAFVPEDSVTLKRPDKVESHPEPEDSTIETSKKKSGKHHKKKKHSKHEHHKQNEAWYTFIRRAFIETMDPEAIEEEFGH